MRTGERLLVIESPEMHGSASMQSYISKEVNRPCKQWIHEVLLCKREVERVKLRTVDFVLLPDVDCVKRSRFDRIDKFDRFDRIDKFDRIDRIDRFDRLDRLDRLDNDLCKADEVVSVGRFDSIKLERFNQFCLNDSKEGKDFPKYETDQADHTSANILTLPHGDYTLQKGDRSDRYDKRWRTKRISPSFVCFHWLAVATDTNLRTLRDLRGCHINMLTSLYARTCQRIHDETGVDPSQIMAYVHYPPSVYQLHIHFKHLAAGISHDTLRVHPLPTILNNLQIDSEYYSKSRLQLPVYVHTDLYLALGLESLDRGKMDSMLLPPSQLSDLSLPSQPSQPNQQSQPSQPNQPNQPSQPSQSDPSLSPSAQIKLLQLSQA
jgi:hypothetical protein